MQWFFNSRVLTLVALGVIWLGSTVLLLVYLKMHHP
jgi:hypothetical protein